MSKKQEFIMLGVLGVIILILMMVLLVRGCNDDSRDIDSSVSTEDIQENTSEYDSTLESSSEEKTTEQESSTEMTTQEETTEEQTTEQIVIPVEYPYLIKVNRIANCLTVYAKDANGEYTVPHKAITVSCGKIIEDTPLGEYNTIISYDWRLMFDGTYGHYAYRIVGSTLFHSVPYYTASNDDLEWMEYNKLGSPASLGCVRMTVADAKWLVENCPIGTKVIIYDDINNPGPLGKPETIKIPADSPYRGWDPTDPNPNNPWHNYSAYIEYPLSKTVNVTEGDSINDVLRDFVAKDTCGNDITNKIKITGTYDLNTPGTYKDVLISVTDAIGSYAEVKVTITVKEKEKPTEEVTTEELTTEEVTTENIEEDTTDEKEEDTTQEETTYVGDTILESE